MKIKNIVLLIAGLLAIMALYGCSEREDIIKPTEFDNGIVINTANEHNVRHLDFQMFGKTSIAFQIYLPEEYEVDNSDEPYPVLYMLTPWGESEFFYFNNGLKEIADKMIAEGEIDPMLIVCISGYTDFGGCFYGDSWAGGKYAETISNIHDPFNWTDSAGTMLDYFIVLLNDYERHPASDEPGYPGARGISGIGMGGYGAMRAALEYSDNFGAVSVVSAPLDFDGTTNDAGFIPLFDDLMDEIGSANYSSMQVDLSEPIPSMFFAAAAAYSPHDTGYIDSVIADGVIDNPDTYFGSFTIAPDAEVHLPFDENGDIVTDIWNLWLDNNLPNILADNTGALDEIDMLIMYSDTYDEYSYNEQTMDFIDLLTGTYGKVDGSSDFETMSFSGYTGFDGSTVYLWDLLPKILKYHNDHFTFER